MFGSGGSRIGGGRGPSFGFRFFCYALLSVVLMFYDRRGGWLDTARYGLQAAIYPLQLAVNSPSAAWRWMQESFTTRETLQKEVDALRNQLRDQQLMTMRQAALESENATLRGLTSAMPEVIEKRLIGEVISVEVSTLRQRLLVNRGGNSGVSPAQPVITGDGVLGQVFRIGPFSSEIILITDSEHALPVQVLRSGVRTIALGTGRATALELPYVPQNYDVKVGDVLVTSGLDGVFPFGLPVARVTRVERDPTQPLAQIVAAPLARIESDREVLFIWARPGHPAAPATAEAWQWKRPNLRRRRSPNRNRHRANRRSNRRNRRRPKLRPASRAHRDAPPRDGAHRTHPRRRAQRVDAGTPPAEVPST